MIQCESQVARKDGERSHDFEETNRKSLLHANHLFKRNNLLQAKYGQRIEELTNPVALEKMVTDAPSVSRSAKKPSNNRFLGMNPHQTNVNLKDSLSSGKHLNFIAEKNQTITSEGDISP